MTRFHYSCFLLTQLNIALGAKAYGEWASLCEARWLPLRVCSVSSPDFVLTASQALHRPWHTALDTS